jgi:Tfp pilus assembly protein FimT
MAVVGIVGVMASVAMFGVKGYGNGASASSLARNIHVQMMRARAESVGDNFQRQLACNTLGCTYQIAPATSPGSGTIASNTFIDAGDKVVVPSRATIWNIYAGTDVNVNHAGSSQMASGTTTYIQFKPDGSATAATIYVNDRTGGSGKGNQYKVYVYPGTGMSRLVNNW